MKYEKPDGTIEIESSGCCCPPGKRRDGMHTNSFTHWWRVNQGEWQRYDSLNSTRLLAGAAETCTEFEEAMENE